MIGLSACVHQSFWIKSSVPSKETVSVEQQSLGDERGWSLEFSGRLFRKSKPKEPDSLFILGWHIGVRCGAAQGQKP